MTEVAVAYVDAFEARAAAYVRFAEERLRRRADNEFVLHLNSFLHLKKASRFDSLFVFCILMLIFLLPRDA
jgi:hypothetical protein